MSNERLSMPKLKQLIGLQSSNLSVRAMGRALDLSVGAVSKHWRAVRRCGIGVEFDPGRHVFVPSCSQTLSAGISLPSKRTCVTEKHGGIRPPSATTLPQYNSPITVSIRPCISSGACFRDSLRKFVDATSKCLDHINQGAQS
jgi:hypothetical protein